MNINRSNYEDYFLLYTDRELSAEDMLVVERFAAAHPDLAVELNSLLQCRLEPELAIPFPEKAALYKTASSNINRINYETYFLLLLDEELDGPSSKQTLDFIESHPELEQEWKLLQQTKLSAENIAFPDRGSLYRHTAKQVPLIRLQWWKIAMAAALIGWMLVGKQFFIAADDKQVQVNTKPMPSPAQHMQSLIHVPSNNGEPAIHNRQDLQMASNRNKKMLFNAKQDKSPVIEENSMAHIEPATTINIHSSNQETMLPKANPALSNHTGISIASIDNEMQQAVYKELDTDDENKSLYLGTMELNKDKLRGLFRKASGFIKGKIKTEEETNDSNTYSLK